jgi:hypothetical protein
MPRRCHIHPQDLKIPTIIKEKKERYKTSILHKYLLNNSGFYQYRVVMKIINIVLINLNSKYEV